MFKIAICDDDETLCSHLESILLDYSQDTGFFMEVDIFNDGMPLYEALRDEGLHKRFDLIFLDIEMHKLNGMAVAEQIRDTLHDNITQIVYISSKQDYAMSLFDTNPLNFLEKPINPSTILNVETERYLFLHRTRHMNFMILCQSWNRD